ncbi:3'-5' exonuclease [Caloramator sp. CAR-1]|uniref:3'-5' exonuclease n=1 Tax=Caloramator sp. CAR-1 TaxID=3062777 RepID=UPI0026E437E4|nr:3'-5' exonuclease [Caloramator sp. CAR-1]MDO6353569.1 3'-5' exonuclease [Caloramator sp. CAR-1]
MTNKLFKYGEYSKKETGNGNSNKNLPFNVSYSIKNKSTTINDPIFTKKIYNEFIVLDFETTGLYPETDKIIEVSALKYKDGIKVDEFHTLINPKIKIPSEITMINGITNAMVKNKPTLQVVLPNLLEFIGDLPIVAHNAPFDAKFLKYAVLYTYGEDTVNNEFIDTLNIAREIYPRLVNYKLETIKKYLQLNLESHRAYDDTLVTAQIYLDYCKKKREEYMSQIPTYDPIDEDIYKCFIAHKSGMNEKIGTWEDFYKIEEKIAEICNEHGGRYYKSSSKNAKFAIIFNYTNRTKSCVDTLRNKGYKVTTFEEALKFFGLEDMWNIESLQEAEKEYKEYIYGFVN